MNFDNLLNNNPIDFLKLVSQTNPILFKEEIIKNKEKSFFLNFLNTSYTIECIKETYDLIKDFDYNPLETSYNKEFDLKNTLKVKYSQNIITNQNVPDILWIFKKNHNVFLHVFNSLSEENINKLREYPMLEIGLLSNNKEIINALVNKSFKFKNNVLKEHVKNELKDPLYKDIVEDFWKLNSDEETKEKKFEHLLETFDKMIKYIDKRNDYHSKEVVNWLKLKFQTLEKEEKLALLKKSISIPDIKIFNTIKKNLNYTNSSNEYLNFLVDNLKSVNNHNIIVEPIIENIKILNDFENGWINFAWFLKNKKISLNQKECSYGKNDNHLSIERSFFSKITKQLNMEDVLNIKINNKSIYSQVDDSEQKNLNIGNHLKGILNIDPEVNGVLLSKKLENLTDSDVNAVKEIWKKIDVIKEDDINLKVVKELNTKGFFLFSHPIITKILPVDKKEILINELINNLSSYNTKNYQLSTWEKDLKENTNNDLPTLFKSIYLSMLNDEGVNWSNIKINNDKLKEMQNTEFYFDLKARVLHQELTTTTLQLKKETKQKNKI